MNFRNARTFQNEAYDPAASPETPVEDFNSHTYEDILATAILNKVSVMMLIDLLIVGGTSYVYFICCTCI